MFFNERKATHLVVGAFGLGCMISVITLVRYAF